MGSGNPGVISGTPGVPLLLPGVLPPCPGEGVGMVGGRPLAEEAVHAVGPRGRGAGAVMVAQGLGAPEKEGNGG